MEIYVINLDRQTARMAHMAQTLKGLRFERVAAVDGSKLEGPLRRTGGVPTRHAHMTRMERACAASHRLCWQRFLETAAAWACVLEDDVEFGADFQAWLTDGSWIPAGCGIIKLETFVGPTWLARRGITVRDRRLRRLLGTHLGSAGYIVSRDAARALLARSDPPRRPVDHLLFDAHLHDQGMHAWQLEPALCWQADRVVSPTLAQLEASQQQAPLKLRRNVPQKLAHETLRPFRQAMDLAWRLYLALRGERRVVGYR